LTFLPFSESFWRIPDKLVYHKNNNNNNQGEDLYLDYKNALVNFNSKRIFNWNVNNDMPWIYDRMFKEKYENK
jgi:hypothetical protein